jgi:beta-glucosidase
MAVKAGCDLNCGNTYAALPQAVAQGLIDEATIDQAVRRLFTARFRLGMFDPPEQVPYAQIPYAVNDAPEHQALALQVARESMVLLKNENNLLPLPKTLKTIAVIGPNAADAEVLWGNYNGVPSNPLSLLDGIRAALGPETELLYAQGCHIINPGQEGYAEALAMAERAEVVIFIGGISQLIEGEEGQVEGVDGGLRSKGDRIDLNLPVVQEALLQALHATGKPVILVLVNGSALAVNWADANLPAILEAWYPGQAGGAALAEVLFGDYNPAGRLPVTFYKSVEDLPPFVDYRIAAGGRTYRYFRGEPLYPFGYGLSSTTFSYTNLQLSAESVARDQGLTVSATVQNTGSRAGDEVVQLYLNPIAISTLAPIRQLRGFERISLAPGEVKTVSFTLTPGQIALINDAGQAVVEPGQYQLTVGGRQPRPQDLEQPGDAILVGMFEVV